MLLLIIVLVVIAASPCAGQTRVTSPGELQRALAAGDDITLITFGGKPITGRVTTLRADELQIEDATVPFDTIQSLERRRDSVRNGTLLGAGVGAGLGGAMFAYAAAVDRNEIDEWAPTYLAATAIFTGIGAFIGWAIDNARSKPHIRFDAPAGKGRN